MRPVADPPIRPHASRASEAAVSSVVGTLLMLAITVTVFAGLSIVVLGELAGDATGPRSDIRIVDDGVTYLLRHNGGDPLPLATGTLRVTVSGVETTYGMTEFAASVADGATWRIGESVCISGSGANCLLAGATVEGLVLSYGNRALVLDGVAGIAGPSGGQPDLVVALDAMTPASPTTGQPTTFTARVTNSGLAAVPGTAAMTVHFYVDAALIGSTSTNGPLAAGASLTTTSPAWTATQGSHTLKLVVDEGASVSEANEANNEFTLPFTIASGASDPGFAFEDVNGDGVYNPADGDVAIPNADVQDGMYTAPAGSGLVIPPSVGPIVANLVDFEAPKDVVIQVDVTATNNHLQISAGEDVVATGITFDGTSTGGGHDVKIDAGGDIDLTGTTLTRLGGDVEVTSAGGTITMSGASVDAKKQIRINDPGGTVILDGADLTAEELIRIGQCGPDAATIQGRDLTVTGGDDVKFCASGSIDLSASTPGGTTIVAEGQLDIGRDAQRADAIDVTDAALTSNTLDVDLYAEGPITMVDATITATAGKVRLRADAADVDGTGVMITAKQQVEIGDSSGGDPDDVTLAGSQIESDDEHIRIYAAGAFDAQASTWDAKREIQVGRQSQPAASADLADAEWTTTNEFIQIWTDGVLTMTSAELAAQKRVDFGASGDEVDSVSADDVVITSVADKIRFFVIGAVDLKDATLTAAKDIEIGRGALPVGALTLTDAAMTSSAEAINVYASGAILAQGLEATAAKEIDFDLDAASSDLRVDDAILDAGTTLRAWLQAAGTVYVGGATFVDADNIFDVGQSACPAIDPAPPLSGTVSC